MTDTKINLALAGAACLVLAGVTAGRAAGDVPDADKAFVAKVSQGGMYEVALGKVAEKKAMAQNIRDQGNTEAHDHELVGAKLKSIAKANGLPFPSKLDAEFTARLDKLKALPADKFDAAYVKDMIQIHDGDGAAFAKEAKEGTNPALKAFADETHKIVQRHLGELNVKTD